MPSLAQFSTASIKALNVGKPGMGKTGALISVVLADPEARLFIANFDRGNIRTLANLMQFDITTRQPRPPEVVHRLARQINYHDFGDNISTVNGELLITGAITAFTGLGHKLNNWGNDIDGKPLGGMKDWGPKDWFVPDSVSAMGDAAMRYATFQAKRLNKRPQQEDWGEAIARLSLLLEMTNDPSVVCNVMANTHVRRVGDLEGPTDEKGKPKEIELVPNALGQKLPQEIGRYFSDILETREDGEGLGAIKKIYTKSPGGLTLRSSNPAMVQPSYNINELDKWVRDVRSAPTPAATAAPSGPAPAAPTT